MRMTASSRTMAPCWHQTHQGPYLQTATTRRLCAAWPLRIRCARPPIDLSLQLPMKRKVATTPRLLCAGYRATAAAAMNRGIHLLPRKTIMEKCPQPAVPQQQQQQPPVLVVGVPKSTHDGPATPSNSSSIDPRSGHERAKGDGKSRQRRQLQQLKCLVVKKCVVPPSASIRSNYQTVPTATQRQSPSGS